MEYFREFDLKTQKQHSNRWMARPPGMEGVELVKDPGAFIPTGEETQGNALQIVRERKQEANRKLTEEGMGEEMAAKAASRATYRPKLHLQSDLSAQTTLIIR